jgi:hypothetical protein
MQSRGGAIKVDVDSSKVIPNNPTQTLQDSYYNETEGQQPAVENDQQETNNQKLFRDNKVDMLRMLRDKEEIKRYISEADCKKKCCYKSCLI